MLPTGGAPTVTVTERVTLALAPLQVKVNVLVVVSAPLDSFPEVAFDPDHAPEAMHEDALEDDQMSEVEPPFPTEDGFAENDTEGVPPGGGGGGGGGGF